MSILDGKEAMKQDFKTFTKEASLVYHQLGSPEKKALKQRSSECSQVLSSASIMKKATKIFGQIQKLVRFIRHGQFDTLMGSLEP